MIQAPLSDFLTELVEANCLLPGEAQALNRLPPALQEKAVQQSEALRIQNIQKVVSGLLNPVPIATPKGIKSFQDFRERLARSSHPFTELMGIVVVLYVFICAGIGVVKGFIFLVMGFLHNMTDLISHLFKG